MPAIALAGLWFGGEALAVVTSIAIGVAWSTRPLGAPTPRERPRDGVTGLPLRAEAVEIMGMLHDDAAATARSTASFVLGLDDPGALAREMTETEFDMLLRRTAERLRHVLRDSDRLARLEGPRFAIMLSPTAYPDLEAMIQLAQRLQAACELPLPISGRTIAATCHVGFCLMGRSPARSGEALLSAAETAAMQASRSGPSAIRAYANDQNRPAGAQGSPNQIAREAIENGQVTTLFQPQLDTDTGALSGVQAVARWLHTATEGAPEADDMMGTIDSPHLRERLSEIMLYQSLTALREWGRRGIATGPVSLPFCAGLLGNPKLPERLTWEFDRFDVAPAQIRLVLMQDVMAHLNDEVIWLNLGAVAALGCGIELAGFGNGPLSVSAIRRTAARRLRIHRSLVSKLESHDEQRQSVAALIAMAEKLGLETLADGVGSTAEHTLLAQLGCRHVQGKAIARPMAMGDLCEWDHRHRAKLAATPRLLQGGGV
ncbi:GGDEF domain-containing protein [Sinirhodobacter sp. WL0062]|uniref:GGDEF domain-containing protein n=1 Tax=Rhodobacter flavimaris TaxID=2907145 RepID=A0ABS8YUY8_9RHOB|nr:GGDEF domain-containing protein [Sinirhodobacter sp. WL0062]MCE5973659.1 GGDEF domain-containing protein [Sinirhodobacter sp. WL0062]